MDDAPGAGEIGHRGKGGDVAHHDTWGRARRAGRQAASPGSPQGKLPSGGVADGRHPGEIQARVVQQPEVIDGRGHVIEGRRPAASLIPAEPAVLDVPGGDAPTGKVGGERPRRHLAVRGMPVPAMQHDRDGEGTVAARHVQVGHLHLMVVGVGVVGGAAESRQRDAQRKPHGSGPPRGGFARHRLHAAPAVTPPVPGECRGATATQRHGRPR